MAMFDQGSDDLARFKPRLAQNTRRNGRNASSALVHLFRDEREHVACNQQMFEHARA